MLAVLTVSSKCYCSVSFRGNVLFSTVIGLSFFSYSSSISFFISVGSF